MLQAQNVGIGTTTPTGPLTVIANDTAKGLVQKTGNVEIGFWTNTTAAYLQTWSPTNLNFATGNGSEKITLVHSTGFVGINTNLPTAQMDINGTMRLRNNGAAVGNVLTSDASGNATWQAPAAPVRNDVYSVGSVDFKADVSSNPISISGGTGGAYYTVPYYSNMVAPVHLPNGAKITQITVWYLDNSTTEDISFTFYGEFANAGFYTGLATGTSSGASTSYRSVNLTLTSNPLVVNNSTYAYQINGFAHWPGTSNGLVIKGVQIQYNY